MLVQHGAARPHRRSRHRLPRHHPQLQIHQRRLELGRSDRRLGAQPESAPRHARPRYASDPTGGLLHGNRRRSVEEHRRGLDLHQSQRQHQLVPVLRHRGRRAGSRTNLRRRPGQQFRCPHGEQRVVIAGRDRRRLYLPHQPCRSRLLLHHVLPVGWLAQRLALDQRLVRGLRGHQRLGKRNHQRRPHQLGHPVSTQPDQPEHPVLGDAPHLQIDQLRNQLDADESRPDEQFQQPDQHRNQSQLPRPCPDRQRQRPRLAHDRRGGELERHHGGLARTVGQRRRLRSGQPGPRLRRGRRLQHGPRLGVERR